MNTHFLIVLALLSGMFFFCACNDNGKLPEPIDKIWESGNIDTNRILSGKMYFEGIVKVTKNSILTIRPGTELIFNSAIPSALIIDQGSQINAIGTPSEPITFTSDKATPGAWGGVIILGKSTVMNDDPTVPVDYPGLQYGGNISNDNSGTLKYVRILYGGGVSNQDPKITSIYNGLTLCGVGNKTTIDYVQVHKSKRNGISIFGGGVDMRHTLLTSNDVNSFYYNETWLGRSQFLLIQNIGTTTIGSGIYFLNSEYPPHNAPSGSPRFHNTTIIGGDGSNYAINREIGGKGQFYNTLILGFEKYKPIRLKDASEITTYFIMEWADIQIKGSNSIDVDDTESFNENDVLTKYNARCTKPITAEYQIRDPFNPVNPDFQTNNLLRCTDAIPYADAFFMNQNSQFYGAVSNTKASDWTLGWTIYP